MRRLCLLLLLCLSASAFAKQAAREVVVADPYLEMHTGPGKGYPVFFVVSRDDKVAVLKERTGWYLVRERQGREGWVREAELLKTLELDGDTIKLDVPTLENLSKSRFQGALMLGDFGGASLISLSGSYGLTDHLAVQLALGHALGNISNAEIATLDVTHTVFPEWRISPYLSMGTGLIRTRPHTTQVQELDSTDQLSFVGVGARIYVSRRFIARAEYHNNYTYTSRNENEETPEWKAGFAFFF
ncbi:MAG: SH3 domain-containing protein [Steroidobacteraceae bacterium]